MASFVNEPQKTNDPSYLGTSQGTEKAGMQQLASIPDIKSASIPSYQSDTTYGKLFAGVGDVLDTVVKGTDSAIKENIKTDLYKRVDNIRDQFGVAQATNDPVGTAKLAASASEGAIPKSVEVSARRLGNKVEGLTDRYNNGDLQDSAYWTRVEAEIRAVRAQYPGYRDYIDEKTSQITGTTPANALRRALLQDVSDLFKKQNSASDKQTTFEHQNAEIIGQAMPNYFTLKAQGKAPPFAVMEDVVAQYKAQDAVYDRQKKQLGLKDAIGKDMIDDASSAIADRAGTIVTRRLNSAANMAGYTNFQDFFTKMQSKVASGGVLTPQEIDGVRNGAAQLRLGVQTDIQKELAQPWSEHDPKQRSFSTIMAKDPQRMKALMDEAMRPIDAYEQAIINKDTGLLGSLAASTKAMQDHDMGKAMRENDTFRKVIFANNALGPQAMPHLLMGDDGSSLVSDLHVALKNISFGNITKGDETSLSQAWKRGQDKKMDPTYFRKTIDDSRNAVEKGDITTPQGKTSVLNHANALFSPSFNFLERITKPEDRNNVFTALTSPIMAKKMNHLRDTPEGQETWNNYQRWATNSWEAMTKVQIDTVQQGISDKDVTIKYDPKTFTFSATPNARVGGGPIDNWIKDQFRTDYDTPINEVNKGLRNLAELYKANGNDPNSRIYEVVSSMLNQNAPKNKSFMEGLVEAVKAHTGENGPLAPKKTSTPVKAGNISDSPVIAIDTKDIPEGMSARDFIKQLQDKNRPQR